MNDSPAWRLLELVEFYEYSSPTPPLIESILRDEMNTFPSANCFAACMIVSGASNERRSTRTEVAREPLPSASIFSKSLSTFASDEAEMYLQIDKTCQLSRYFAKFLNRDATLVRCFQDIRNDHTGASLCQIESHYSTMPLDEPVTMASFPSRVEAGRDIVADRIRRCI